MRWKGVKWNWVLVVIRLVFKTPQVRASSSDLVTTEFVSYFTLCYGTYSINHLTGTLSLLPIDRNKIPYPLFFKIRIERLKCSLRLAGQTDNLYQENQEVDLNIPLNNWGPKIVWGFKTPPRETSPPSSLIAHVLHSPPPPTRTAL